MPNRILPAVRALGRPPVRRLPHLLALTAVALPLVALAPVPAGVPADPTPAPAVAVAPASPPATVVASPGQRVLVVEPGLARSTRTAAPTVAAVLRELGVTVGPLDRVEPAPTTRIDGPTTVRVRRVTLHEEQVEVSLPAPHVRVEDDALLRGYRHIDRAGTDGLRVDTRLVMTVDGRVESRLTVARETLWAPEPRVERLGTRTRVDEVIWDALARCEASGRWDVVRLIDGRPAYYGGLQFSPRTWDAFRPPDFPALASDATREQQILVAERVLARQGWGAWPACSERLGLR
jgi:hypothetical protein